MNEFCIRGQAVVGVIYTLSIKAKILFLVMVNQVKREIMKIDGKGIVISVLCINFSSACYKWVDLYCL